jgi:hypothetical protein
MPKNPDSRFDAEIVVRVATLNERGRFEMQFSDSSGKRHVISLPLPAAVALGRLICDVCENAPFLMGGIQLRGHRK